MKYFNKIIICFTLLITGLGTLQAQIHTWSRPAAFLEDEEIIIYFNVCGTDLAGKTGPMTLWSAANGGALESSGECDTVSEDIYKFTLTPSAFYGTSIDSINGKLVDPEGAETDLFTLTPFDFSVASGAMLTIYPQPASFGENVSLVFNAALSDRDDLSGVSPIYMWSWADEYDPAEPPGQGSWGAYTDKALCQQIDGDIWRKDFVPLEYWETTTPMTEFGCLFANSSGTAQTEDQLVPVLPPFNCDKPAVSFPRSFTQNDVVTIICNTNLEQFESLKAVDDIYIWSFTNDGDSTDYNPLPAWNWIVYPPDEVNKAKMENLGGGIHELNMIPTEYFGVDDPEYVIESITIVFRNRLGSIQSLETPVDVLIAD
jgi:hypothetical protein